MKPPEKSLILSFSGKLTLKIPWKNLYKDAVVATLDGLYLLVVPGAGRCCCFTTHLACFCRKTCLVGKMILPFFSWIFVARKYDAAKEERFQQEAKQRELQRIEGALQTAARRGETGCSLLSHPFLRFFSLVFYFGFSVSRLFSLRSALYISHAFHACSHWQSCSFLVDKLIIVL